MACENPHVDRICVVLGDSVGLRETCAGGGTVQLIDGATSTFCSFITHSCGADISTVNGQLG